LYRLVVGANAGLATAISIAGVLPPVADKTPFFERTRRASRQFC